MARRPSIPSTFVDLEASGRQDLAKTWAKAFGRAPADTLSIGLVRKVLAHEAQCQQFGGLSAENRRLLQSLAVGKAVPKQSPGSLVAGAHLVREWNGRTYRVEVVDGGYRHDGRVYRSLTAIARQITGANWSGPRFFGLTTRGKA